MADKTKGREPTPQELVSQILDEDMRVLQLHLHELSVFCMQHPRVKFPKFSARKISRYETLHIHGEYNRWEPTVYHAQLDLVTTRPYRRGVTNNKRRDISVHTFVKNLTKDCINTVKPGIRYHARLCAVVQWVDDRTAGVRRQKAKILEEQEARKALLEGIHALTVPVA